MEDVPFGVRVGTFFVVMGLGSFILFVASDLAAKPDFDYLFVAMLLIGIGWMFRSKKPPTPSAGRFSIFRGLQEGSAKRKAEREKAQKGKK